MSFTAKRTYLTLFQQSSSFKFLDSLASSVASVWLATVIAVKKRYPLQPLLLIAFCADIYTYDSWLHHVGLCPSRLVESSLQTSQSRWYLNPSTEAHIVSSYDSHLQFLLSVDAVAIKCDEQDSIHLLLDELDATNALTALDALACLLRVVNQALKVGGDYLPQIKSNRPTLPQELKDSFPRTGWGVPCTKKKTSDTGALKRIRWRVLSLVPRCRRILMYLRIG